MKLHGVLLTLILVVIVAEGVRKRQDRRQGKKLGPHQRQLAREQQQQHPQQQRRPRRQQQKPQRQQQQQQPQRQQQQPKRQPRQQQQQKKGQGRGRPRPAAARKPRVGPPAAAIGSNLPDLKKLPNTKFECDESKRCENI